MLSKLAHKINEYSILGIPFFFLIDFENLKPLIIPISEMANSDISITINGAEYGRKIKHKSFDANIIAPEDNFAPYKSKFDIVKKNILQGNAYLVNLTQRTKLQNKIDLEAVYCNTNAYLKICKQNDFVCFSPERFITITDNKIYSFPMKGTISAEIQNAEQKLIDNHKELFEHYTIVDLIRNDLSMVSTNVTVEKFRYIDVIKTANNGEILQTSSQILGQLNNNWRDNLGYIITKQLPAGSISGAPKTKCLEIIKQAEVENRGYYTAVSGVFDGKDLYSGVVIRYIEQQGNEFHYRSGGGITNKSDVNEEYKELIEKIYVPTI